MIIGSRSHSRTYHYRSVNGRRSSKASYLFTILSTVTLPFLLLLLLLLSIPQTTNAQAVQTCSCSPPTYYWKLDFSRGCPLVVTGVGGYRPERGYCSYDTLDNPNHDGDFTPVKITDLSFIEMNQSLVGVKTLQITDTTLLDGDSIAYESTTSSSGEITGGVQGKFIGVNAAGHAFELEFFLRFSNLCEILPFHVGDSLGFLTFTEIEQPRAETCNFSSQTPSKQPSSRPSKSPTHHPTPSPSTKPSISPTHHPTPSPSTKPSITPTVIDSESPTINPTYVPSFSPTKDHSVLPSPSPSAAPTVSPTIVTQNPTSDPSPTPSKTVTVEPTTAPTHRPTVAPFEEITSPPSSSPTKRKTITPTKSPTIPPSFTPTKRRTTTPTRSPTSSITKAPTNTSIHPTTSPSVTTTSSPTETTTEAPTCIGKGGKGKGSNLRSNVGKGKGNSYKSGNGKGYTSSPSTPNPSSSYHGKGKGSSKTYSPESSSFSKGKGERSQKKSIKCDKNNQVLEPYKDLHIPLSVTWTSSSVTQSDPKPIHKRTVRRLRNSHANIL